MDTTHEGCLQGGRYYTFFYTFLRLKKALVDSAMLHVVTKKPRKSNFSYMMAKVIEFGHVVF